MTNITHLPEDCLLYLMTKFSLKQSISIRLVCSHWKHLIKHYRYRPLKFLKLFGTPSDVKEYTNIVSTFELDLKNTLEYFAVRPSECLFLKQSSLIAYNFLADLFPNVETFVYYYKNRMKPEHIDLNYLFAKWSPTLKTVILHRLRQNAALSVIDLPALSSLYILEQKYKQVDPLLLHVLPQVKHLMLNVDFMNTEKFMSEKIFLANCKKLKHLNLICGLNRSLFTTILPRINREFCNNLTRLSINGFVFQFEVRFEPIEALEILKMICTQFPNLEYFQSRLVKYIPLQEMITELVKLKHLTQLSIELQDNPFYLLQINTHLPQLESIRDLGLKIIMPLIRLDRLAQTIGHLFPNLKRLTLNCGHHSDAKALFEKAFHGRLFELKFRVCLKNGTLNLSHIYDTKPHL